MIASLSARPDRLAEVEAIALSHVRRARTEPGCLGHEVARDMADPCRFIFTERWVDLAALATHSISDRTRATVDSLGDLIAGPTTFDVYDATLVTLS